MEIISTKSPWGQKKYIVIGGFYVGVLFSGLLLIGLNVLDSIITIDYELWKIIKYVIAVVSFSISFYFYFNLFMKSQIWVLDGMQLFSKKLSKPIDLTEVEIIYNGIERPKSKFLIIGSLLAKSYYPDVPNYYDKALVFLLPGNKIFSLSLYHLENGELIMNQIKLILENKMSDSMYSSKKLYKTFSSNKVIQL